MTTPTAAIAAKPTPTMRAMQYAQYGGPERLTLVEAPVPEPGVGQLRVRVRASSVNPVDWKLASGHTRPFLWVSPPSVPGFDLAGIVDAHGGQPGPFAIGDRVHARCTLRAGGGCADYAIVPVADVAHVPPGMSFADAAALPLAGQTALQALRDHGGLALDGASPARVLVTGAAGGVGHLGVQLARATGAHVTAVCSRRNEAFVRTLGAQAVVVRDDPDAWAGHRDFDVILDNVGAELDSLIARLTLAGTLLCVSGNLQTVARLPLNLVRTRQVRLVMLKANGADLAALDRLWADGRLRVSIERRYPLASLGEAWTRSASGRVVGKLVVDVSAG